jgi:hypothetical protein
MFFVSIYIGMFYKSLKTGTELPSLVGTPSNLPEGRLLNSPPL